KGRHSPSLKIDRNIIEEDQMRAVLFKGKDSLPAVESVKMPKPVKDEVLIRMHCAALNHRDLWLLNGQAKPNEGIALGSDGSGVVEDVGDDADPLLVGAE